MVIIKRTLMLNGIDPHKRFTPHKETCNCKECNVFHFILMNTVIVGCPYKGQ